MKESKAKAPKRQRQLEKRKKKAKRRALHDKPVASGRSVKPLGMRVGRFQLFSLPQVQGR